MGGGFNILCLCLGSLQVLPLRQCSFISSVSVGGKYDGIPLALQEVNQLMPEHPGLSGAWAKGGAFGDRNSREHMALQKPSHCAAC